MTPEKEELLDAIAETATKMSKMVVSKLYGDSIQPSFWFLRSKQIDQVNRLRAMNGVAPILRKDLP